MEPFITNSHNKYVKENVTILYGVMVC